MKPGKAVVGLAVFVIGLGVGLPPTSGRTRSAAIAMANTRSSGLLAKISGEYWEFLQKRNLALRLRMGLPVEELPDLSEARARADAQFGAALLEKLPGSGRTSFRTRNLCHSRCCGWKRRSSRNRRGTGR